MNLDSFLIAYIIFTIVLVIIMMVTVFSIVKQYKNKQDSAAKEREIKRKISFSFTLTVTFILMFFAVVYTSRMLYNESISSLYGECEDKVSNIAADLSDYLNTTESVLWVTGDSADQMYQNGSDLETLHDYLRVETQNQKEKFDKNFMGFYAVFDGVFMSGIDWIAPDDYDPYERDWYKAAKEADGDVALVDPYLDAQSGDVIISASKLLSDKKNVVSLDVSMNRIQETVQEININGNGYGMIIDKKGNIVSHKDPALNGKNCKDIFEDDSFINAVLETKNGRTEIVIDGFRYTIFVNEVLDQWYTIVLVKNMELLSDIHIQLITNIGVYLIILLLIAFFYYLSYVNEKSASEVMEELIISKQKQEYESKVLKLEKSAADDANKAKSRFLADMSHEIRTPINAVLGMNEMILRETESDSIKEYAGNIKSSGRALLALINTILDFSKIEDGKMEIAPVDYSSVDMIHYLQNSIAERAASKKLKFIVDVDKSIPKMLHGDDMRVSQVINNLLTNAVKYTKEGEVRLTFNNNGCKDNEIYLYVEVKDTGIGIKEEDMSKMFESFERLDVEKNRNIEGTGLGMSIVMRLLSMMGSELHVDSVYGVGSTFSFEIKQGIVDETPIGDSYEEISEGSKKSNAGNSYQESFRAPDGHILFVDDTKMNLTVATNLLKKTLLNIDTAISGDKALELCDKHKYDVIFMDQRMPGMDGTETLHQIKRKKSSQNIDTPVICLTADAISGARDRYIAEGFSDYLTKPVEGSELERMLLKYLPEGKIVKNIDDVRVGEEAEVEEKEEENDIIEKFTEAGVDTEAGLRYSQNDVEMYVSVVSEYVKEYNEKRSNLQKALDEENWKNYAVFVHSLKSTSKMIGVTNIFEEAAEFEKAANEEDDDFIRNGHDDLMEKYERKVRKLADILGIDISEAKDASEDEEIFEFLPQ